MITITIVSLVAVITGLLILSTYLLLQKTRLKNLHKAQIKNQLLSQQKKWSEKYFTLQTHCDDLEIMITSIKELKLEKRILAQRLYLVEDKRDSLLANLAALETQDHYDRCEILEEENKNLTEKVVSLHRNNTEIKLKLDSYKDYARNKDQEILNTLKNEHQSIAVGTT